MSYLIKFTYFAPTNPLDPTDPGHMTVSFIERAGDQIVSRRHFEMNGTEDADWKSMINLDTREDGKFSEMSQGAFDSYGENRTPYTYTLPVDEANF